VENTLQVGQTLTPDFDSAAMGRVPILQYSKQDLYLLQVSLAPDSLDIPIVSRDNTEAVVLPTSPILLGYNAPV